MADTNRLLSLGLDLGGSAQIDIERVEAIEALGRPFTVTVEFVSTLGEIDLFPHLGKPCSVASWEAGEKQREFNGIIAEAEFMRESGGHSHYRLSLRPWTHLLNHNRRYAIYQDQTTLEIIQKVFTDAGASDVEYGKLSGSSRKRPYCVQYGESDFAFVSRLMEEDGYYYFFDHKDGKHILTMCNAPGSHVAAKKPELVFNPTSDSLRDHGADDGDGDGKSGTFVHRWIERLSTGSEQLAHFRDYDFEQPDAPIFKDFEGDKQHAQDQAEIQTWPGGFVDLGTAGTLAQVQIEARRAERQSYSSESQLASLTCGAKITLTDHPTERFDRGYMITRTHHIMASETYESNSGQAGPDQLILFECVPDDVKYRAAQITPRPVVRGPETAIVTGPKNETIHTDEYARVMVRFHWDRAETAGEKSTCWIRVSQTGGLGNVIMPRVGHEVIVDFLDGDPDRPIVVGRVFNKSHMPIYTLPDNKTRMLWRSYTYKDQTSYGEAKKWDIEAVKANEIRFEDQGGKEEVFIHAERDMNTHVRHSATHHIGLDYEEKIGGSRDTKIEVSETTDVTKSIKVTAGTTIEMEAKTSITFKVGKSKIVMSQSGITVEALTHSTKADTTLDVKSPKTTVNGDAMLTLKGGMTMIN